MKSEQESAIDLLKGLLSSVVDNTKKNFDGKPSNNAKEIRALTKVLTRLLNRAPSQAEIDLAQKY